MKKLVIVFAFIFSACEKEEGFTLYSAAEWDRISGLAHLQAPPPDRSNKYVGNTAAIALGKRFYFDTDFSGKSTLKDMLGRDIPVSAGRAAKGTRMNVSCNTCHDVSRAGADHTRFHVSIGAGAYDVNSMPTYNVAYYSLFYWNGRNDSLWAQVVAVDESAVSMGGNRLRTAWRIADAYRSEYEALFPEHPLPMAHGIAAQKALLDSDGTCLQVAGGCPAECAEGMKADGSTACFPRLPLEGKPGTKMGCQRGDAAEPFGDAFDCMAQADRDAITRVYVNFAKAIAAYESELWDRSSAFDRFVDGGETSDAISTSAKRGLKLFIGKAACARCHNTPLFSDNQFHNVGALQAGPFVPKTSECAAGASCDCVTGKNCLPWGLRDGLSKLQVNSVRRDSKWSDDPTDDTRAEYYKKELTPELIGQWRTPSLRNVALTAPYMHAGELKTLRDVIEHYNRGGVTDLPESEAVGTRDQVILPLNLTEREVADLESFLGTLTGDPLPQELTSTPSVPAPSPF